MNIGDFYWAFESGNINNKELYKLHTGHALFDLVSDSSSDSIASSSSLLDQNKPTIYTYEELKANMAVKKPLPAPIGSGDYIRQIIKKELEMSELEDSCILCNVMNCSKHDIEAHKVGKSHKKKVDQYIQTQLEELKSSGGSIQQQTIIKELKILVSEDSCRICDVKKCSKYDIKNHKMGKNHKNNVDQYITSRLELFAKQVNKRSDVIQSSSFSSNDSAPRDSNKIIEDKLKKLMLSNFCKICDAFLPDVNQFESHYNSQRHRTNLKAWKNQEIEKLQHSKTRKVFPNSLKQVDVQDNLDKVKTSTLKPSINHFCKVCGINVTTAMKDHCKTKSHEMHSETFCFDCNIRTISKNHLAQHLKGIKHRTHLTNNNVTDSLSIPRTVVTPVRAMGKGSSSGSLNQNTKSNNQIKVEESYTSTQVISQSVPLRWCYCFVCKKSLDGTENAESHYKDLLHITKNTTFYCQLCKKTFSSRTEMDSHAKSFPHNEIAKLMSLIVSHGISTIQRFWKLSDMEIMCTLCNALLRSELSAASHFESSRHVSRFNTWCSQQKKNTKDPNRYWYYCDTCSKPLNGTTSIQFHYQGKLHAFGENSSTNVFQVPNACSSTNIMKSDSSTNTPKIENSGQSNKTVENGKDETCLQEMVQAESIKLIRSLKSIPLDEALHFLRKCIKELENVNKKVVTMDG